MASAKAALSAAYRVRRDFEPRIDYSRHDANEALWASDL